MLSLFLKGKHAIRFPYLYATCVVKKLSPQYYIVIYDGKTMKTYDYRLLSDRSVKPIREFKLKLAMPTLFPSYDCKAIFGLTKNFDVIKINPLTGETLLQIKDLRKTFSDHDLILESTEDFKTLTSSLNGSYIAIASWHGVLVHTKEETHVIRGIEYKKKYVTERYVATEFDQWGDERIITKREEHFYFENAHIDYAVISPNGKYIALTESSLFERCYAAIYALDTQRYIILRDNPYEEPIYEYAAWSSDSDVICFLYRDKAFNFGVELFRVMRRWSKRAPMEFPAICTASPLKKMFAFYVADGNILLLDYSRKDLSTKKIARIEEEPKSLKWSPCGKYLMAVNQKKKVFIINIEDMSVTKLKGRFATWFAE